MTHAYEKEKVREDGRGRKRDRVREREIGRQEER
jgi:hypothetical protein